LYFQWVKGVSLYNTTSTITIPTTIPSVTDNTVLLIKSSDNNAIGLGKLAAKANFSNIQNATISLPAGFGSIPTPTIPSIMPSFSFSKKTKFANNSQVYYKPHSLAPGGVGGVKNVRIKSKKT
jgi:hypothetical protein